MATLEYTPKGRIEQSGEGKRGKLVTIEVDAVGEYTVRAYKVVYQELTKQPVDWKTAAAIFKKFTGRRAWQ